MPYTFAHPGFPLLIRKYIPSISSAGVVLGSITPDLDLIFNLHNSRFHLFDYSLLSIITVLLPITWVILIYCQLFAEPVYRRVITGEKQESSSKDIFASMPIEIISILIGILVHLAIDFMAHWNAGLITWIIYGLFGTGNFISYTVFYITWYLPQVLFTLLGFFLIYKYYGNSNSLSEMRLLFKENIRQNISFYVLALVTAVSFIVFRYYFAAIEWSFALHYIVVYLTGGLLFSFFVTPLLFGLSKRLKKIRL